MKTLTLFRHAKSGWDSPVSRDFDRPLNIRGIRGAKLMGIHARNLGLRFDHIVSSPAVRCTETLDGFWEGYGRILHPNWDRRIYLASAANLLDVVQELADEDSSVLMCGHNPGMEDLTLMLVPDTKGDTLRDAVEEKFPTAALAELVFEIDHWRDAREGNARIARFIRPRDLDAALGPELDGD
jgi:phosphohistidine phosphatase